MLHFRLTPTAGTAFLAEQDPCTEGLCAGPRKLNWKRTVADVELLVAGAWAFVWLAPKQCYTRTLPVFEGIAVRQTHFKR